MDDDFTSGKDLFRFEAAVESDSDNYRFVIYRNMPDADETDSCMPTDGAADYAGYSEYSWFNETRDDGGYRDLPENLQGCGYDSAEFNACEDRTADFYIRVQSLTDAPVSCDPYVITLTNGVW